MPYLQPNQIDRDTLRRYIEASQAPALPVLNYAQPTTGAMTLPASRPPASAFDAARLRDFERLKDRIDSYDPAEYILGGTNNQGYGEQGPTGVSPIALRTLKRMSNVPGPIDIASNIESPGALDTLKIVFDMANGNRPSYLDEQLFIPMAKSGMQAAKEYVRGASDVADVAYRNLETQLEPVGRVMADEINTRTGLDLQSRGGAPERPTPRLAVSRPVAQDAPSSPDKPNVPPTNRNILWQEEPSPFGAQPLTIPIDAPNVRYGGTDTPMTDSERAAVLAAARGEASTDSLRPQLRDLVLQIQSDMGDNQDVGYMRVEGQPGEFMLHSRPDQLETEIERSPEPVRTMALQQQAIDRIKAAGLDMNLGGEPQIDMQALAEAGLQPEQMKIPMGGGELTMRRPDLDRTIERAREDFADTLESGIKQEREASLMIPGGETTPLTTFKEIALGSVRAGAPKTDTRWTEIMLQSFGQYTDMDELVADNPQAAAQFIAMMENLNQLGLVTKSER